MKVVFDRDVLIAALIPASAIAPTRNTVSSVEGLLFECPGEAAGTCRLSAYDMEKGMRTAIPARILEEGKFILNAQNILQIARSMPEGELTISVDERYRATVSGGNSRFEINASSGEDFPMLPLLTGDRYYKMPQHTFRTLVTGVSFAVAQNDQRPAFNGALLLVENGVLTLVGCDGNRVAVGEMEAPEGEKSPSARMIIPGKMLSEVMKLTKDTEEEITVMLSRKHVMFHVGTVCFFTRIIDVEYIDYQRIIPDSSKTNVFVSSEAMLGAIERASLITEDKLGGNARTFVKLEIREDSMEISSVSSGGSIHEVIPASVEGPGLVIGFNCRYLLEMLRACPAGMESLHLGLDNPLVGMRVTDGTSGEKGEDPSFTYFVMPVRMQGK